MGGAHLAYTLGPCPVIAIRGGSCGVPLQTFGAGRKGHNGGWIGFPRSGGADCG